MSSNVKRTSRAICRQRVVQLALMLGLCLSGSPAAADELHTSVLVPASFESQSAVGLLLAPQGTVQVSDTDIEQLDGSTVVTFPYEENETTAQTLTTAIAFSADGQTAFGNVQPLPQSGGYGSWLSVPVCERERAPLRYYSELSTIEKVIKVRLQRHQNRKGMLLAQLTEDVVAQLLKFEKGFGLQPQSTPLSADTTALQLTERLARILYALQHYSASKQRPAQGR